MENIYTGKTHSTLPVLTWIVIWLLVRKYNSSKLGDMLYKLLQTFRAVTETRSDFRDRTALNKSPIFHHSGVLIIWLLKAKEPCASEGSQTFSEDTTELPFIQLVEQLTYLNVTLDPIPRITSM